jgi:hypothetical protein
MPTGAETLVGTVHSVKLEAGTGRMRPEAERVMIIIRRRAIAYLVTNLPKRSIPR